MIFLYVILLCSLVCGTFALTILVGRQRFRALVTREVARLLSNAAVDIGSEQLAARWHSLPEPVRRYLGYAVPDGTPGIRTVHLAHDGSFRTKPNQR